MVNSLLWLPRALWKFYIITVFCITFLFLYPFYRITLSDEKWFRYTIFLIQFHTLLLQIFAGIIFSIERHARLERNRPYIICPNHSSYLDIILMYRVVKKHIVFIGKRDIENYPLFHIFFTKKLNILVERTSNVDAHKAFVKAGEMADKGASVVIFPEGGIHHTAPHLHPFKNGAFKLAIEKQIPIVPVTFLDNWKLLQGSKLLKGKAGPGLCRVIVHPVIETTGMKEEQSDVLRKKVYDVINAPLIKEGIYLYSTQL